MPKRKLSGEAQRRSCAPTGTPIAAPIRNGASLNGRMAWRNFQTAQPCTIRPKAAIRTVDPFPSGAPLLQVHDLRTNILKPMSFSLAAGECIAVRGPSGAGLAAARDRRPRSQSRSGEPGGPRPFDNPSAGVAPASRLRAGGAGVVGGNGRRALRRLDSGQPFSYKAGIFRGSEELADRPSVHWRAAAVCARPRPDRPTESVAAG